MLSFLSGMDSKPKEIRLQCNYFQHSQRPSQGRVLCGGGGWGGQTFSGRTTLCWFPREVYMSVLARQSALYSAFGGRDNWRSKNQFRKSLICSCWNWYWLTGYSEPDSDKRFHCLIYSMWNRTLLSLFCFHKSNFLKNKTKANKSFKIIHNKLYYP